ncbi:bacteriocin [Companilactobacillus huachuanensis]|uniref:Bacteriocin n=1 Tax=Companilactobacillus huachuanensis TaxID=2559914 RepID=A0ABW1RN12_9LACO|nr:hypothetical protein [Companilactobacillus huachuanensis]
MNNIDKSTLNNEQLAGITGGKCTANAATKAMITGGIGGAFAGGLHGAAIGGLGAGATYGLTCWW